MTGFRENLYIDKDDPIFEGSLFVGKDGNPTKKAKDLASPHSEDAITWSVFRTLLRIPSCHWLGRFVGRATGIAPPILDMDLECIEFWPHVSAPQSRLLWLLDHLGDRRVQESEGARADPGRLDRIRRRLSFYRGKAKRGRLLQGIAVLEGPTELDALIRHPEFVVAVEAKYLSDLASSTTWDVNRDQLGRVIDIAIELSLQEPKPSFVVLVTDQRSHDPPLLYESLVPRYQAEQAFLKERLPHRDQAELARLAGVGWITWREILEAIDIQGLGRHNRELLSGLARYLSSRGL